MELDLRFKKKISKFYLKDFDIISKDSIYDFNIFYSKISKNQSLDWWFSSPASRYNLSSPFFHNFCIFKFIDHLHKNNKLPKKIIIDSQAIYIELKKYFNKNNIEIKIILKKNRFEKIKIFIKNYLIFLHQFLYRIVQLLIFKILIKNKIYIPNNIIIIDKYIFTGYEIKERYYNGLLKNLDNYTNKIYFVPTLTMIKTRDLLKTYNILRKSNNKYIFKENFYSLYDVFYSLGHFFRKRKLTFNDCQYKDIQYKNIIKEELNNDSIAFFAAVESFLTISFIKKLKDNNIKISKIIDWFENQTVDKAWNYGFNLYYPTVNSLGYKGMAPSQMLQSEIYTLDIERKNKFLPKTIGVIGDGFIEEATRYNKHTPIITCPAFRFNYLWSNIKIENNFKRKILFALPISIDQSLQIISNISSFQKTKYEILIKAHPTTNKNIYIKFLYLNKITNYKFVNLTAEDLLIDIDYFVGGMSSISLEAICLGIRTIIVENNSGINYFTIPKEINKNNYTLLKDGQNLYEIIENLKNKNLNYDDILKIKKKYFEPISKKSLKKFIE